MSDTLVAVELAHWVDPASVFSRLHADDTHAFWLDAGPGVSDGWSWVGAGVPEDDPESIRAVMCATAPAEAWEAGRFRGGWVGWLGYDDAARRAGAPARFDDGMPRQQWLRVDRFVAFDHASRRAWAVAQRVRTGTMSVNGGLWYGADVPFGGYKQSGLGREMGVAGFEEYLETKSVAEPA